MRKLSLIVTMAVCLFFSGTALGGYDYNFPSGIDLSHDRAYYWGIDANNAESYLDLNNNNTITGATLTITNLENWDNGGLDDVLYVSLHDNESINDGISNIYYESDNESGNVDYWDSKPSYLYLTSFSDPTDNINTRDNDDY